MFSRPIVRFQGSIPLIRSMAFEITSQESNCQLKCDRRKKLGIFVLRSEGPRVPVARTAWYSFPAPGELTLDLVRLRQSPQTGSPHQPQIVPAVGLDSDILNR